LPCPTGAFVIGGAYSTDPEGPVGSPSGEIFDLQTNVWVPMSKPFNFGWVCGNCNGCVLADGRVLLGSNVPVTLINSMFSKLTAIWDPTDCARGTPLTRRESRAAWHSRTLKISTQPMPQTYHSRSRNIEANGADPTASGPRDDR
jgi:hypothetical protein